MNTLLLTLIFLISHSICYIGNSFHRSFNLLKLQHSYIKCLKLCSKFDKDAFEELQVEIEKYISSRPQWENVEEIFVERSRKTENTNPFEFIAPKGFFRDAKELAYQKLKDESKPLFPHPLSYAELKKYGFSYLSESILEFGGPYRVGEMIGLNWTEPKVTYKEDLMKPKIIEDISGVMLGNSLENALNDVSKLNFTEIKQRIRSKESQSSNISAVGSANNDPYSVFDEVSYVQTNEQIALRMKEKVETENLRKKSPNRFVLAGQERAHLIFTTMGVAFSFGRASEDLIQALSDDSSAVAILKAAVIPTAALGALSLASALRCGSIAHTEGYGTLTWITRGLLGGPSAFFALQKYQKQNLIQEDN